MQAPETQTTFLKPSRTTGFDFETQLRRWTQALDRHQEHMRYLEYVDDEHMDTKSKIEWATAFVQILQACVRNEQNAVEAYNDFIDKRNEYERVKLRAKQMIEEAKNEVVRAQSVIRYGTW